MRLKSAYEGYQVVGTVEIDRQQACREWLLGMGAEVPTDSLQRDIGLLSDVPEWLLCYDTHLDSLGLE